MIFSELPSGKSVSGDPIQAFRHYVTKNSKDLYIYLIAGVHGDEVEGVYVLEQLYQWIQKQDCFGIPFITVPILNPDGHRMRTRVNAHEVDLNRNLPSNWQASYKQKRYFPGTMPMSEPENIFLDELLAKYTPGLILSFHSWKPMLNYNGNIKKVADFINKFNQYPVQDDIGYPTPGSLGQYSVAEYNCGVLTFECPTIADSQMSLQQIWQESEQGLKSLLTSDLIKEYVR